MIEYPFTEHWFVAEFDIFTLVRTHNAGVEYVPTREIVNHIVDMIKRSLILLLSYIIYLE